ncbi:MAG: nucleoside-diphosphate kinase [Elusimicrobia bacterium]|jgi:nucleoside-diphosphate kinase|nr:MAG: nucleoside-diphosphate kinase [Elusimicrobiota bacterium]
MAETEVTLVIVKPDGLKKSLTGNILTKLAEARFMIVGAKVVRVSRALAEAHYQHLKEKPFFNDLIEYIQGKPYGPEFERVMALVYKGPNAIKKVREIAGATNPEEADSVSIRGSFGRITTKGVFENVIHASSDAKDAEREIKLWFKPEEIVTEIYPTKKANLAATEATVWA